VYGLQSIILHHSFDQVKGRTLRINCADRTHIGGVNGAGKTSVLSLIPAFFGEEPERIISKGTGRLSFVNYYLPSQQSLVIFEYSRYSGVCCAIMYRHPTGKLCYRFIEGAAERIVFELISNQDAQAPERFAHVGGLGAQPDPGLAIEPDHPFWLNRSSTPLPRLSIMFQPRSEPADDEAPISDDRSRNPASCSATIRMTDRTG